MQWLEIGEKLLLKHDETRYFFSLSKFCLEEIVEESKVDTVIVPLETTTTHNQGDYNIIRDFKG